MNGLSQFFSQLIVSSQFPINIDFVFLFDQAPLLYNWNLDALSFVTRVTGMMRAFLMLGALIPLNINSMSIFSFSASLCISGDYIHPAYQMDDIIALIRWMGVAKKRLKIVLVRILKDFCIFYFSS